LQYRYTYNKCILQKVQWLIFVSFRHMQMNTQNRTCGIRPCCRKSFNCRITCPRSLLLAYQFRWRGIRKICSIFYFFHFIYLFIYLFILILLHDSHTFRLSLSISDEQSTIRIIHHCTNYWLLTIDYYWLLTIGYYWQLTIDYWLLTTIDY
jgi:hypothetical protein